MTLRTSPLFALAVMLLAALLAACAPAEPVAHGECLEPGEDGTLVNVPCPDENGTPAPTPTPPPANNELTAGQVAFRANCGACHVFEGVPGATAPVGPDLTQVGARAGDRVAGLSAEEYLRRKLVEPEFYTVEGFQAGIMPSFARLSEEDIDALVELLLAGP